MYFSLGPALIVIALVMGIALLATLSLFRVIKRAFGFPDVTEDDLLFEEWTSADQLTHYSGETVDPQQGQWRGESWPGNAAGRGQSHVDQWQRPNNSGWRQNWTRR